MTSLSAELHWGHCRIYSLWFTTFKTLFMTRQKMTTHSQVNQSSKNHYLNCCLCSWTRLLTHLGHTAGSHALVKQPGHADVIHSSLKKQAGSKPPGKLVKGRQAGPEKCPHMSLRWLWDLKSLFLEILRCLSVHFCPHHKSIVRTYFTRNKSNFYVPMLLIQGERLRWFH